MSTVAARPRGLARRHLVTGADAVVWEVTMLQQAGAQAFAERRDGRLVVTVGDDTADLDAGTQRPCHTDVVCQDDGEVVVRSWAAPPALLVTSDDVHLVPETPGAAGSARIACGERLLVLSAEAYETLPASLVTLLRSLPSRLLHTDPSVVLETLFAEIPVGSGALLERRAPTRVR